MSRRTVIAVGVLVSVVALWFWITSLPTAIDWTTCRRSMDDIRSIRMAIEYYKQDYGEYPVATHTRALQNAVEPKYIKEVPDKGLEYFSDGQSYAIFIRLGAEEGFSEGTCAYEFRDGQFVSWPAALKLTDAQLGKSNPTIE